MKRYLRNSIFHPANEDKCMTMVMSADSLKHSIWMAATKLREEAAQMPYGHLIDIEIFEWDGDFVSATVEAKRRAKKRLEPPERHKITLYDFLIANFENKMLADGGVISTTRPSPLSKEEILEVLLRAVEHPSYREFVISIHDEDGNPVRLKVDKKK